MALHSTEVCGLRLHSTILGEDKTKLCSSCKQAASETAFRLLWVSLFLFFFLFLNVVVLLFFFVLFFQVSFFFFFFFVRVLCFHGQTS